MFALFFGGIALGALVVELTLRNTGVEAAATVVAVSERGRYGDVEVEFTTRTGRAIRAEIDGVDWDGDRPNTGERVDVRYDPADPDTVRQTDRSTFGKYYTPATLGAFSLGMLFAAGRHVRYRLRPPAPRPGSIPAEWAGLLDGDPTSTVPDGRKGRHRAP